MTRPKGAAKPKAKTRVGGFRKGAGRHPRDCKCGRCNPEAHPPRTCSKRTVCLEGARDGGGPLGAGDGGHWDWLRHWGTPEVNPVTEELEWNYSECLRAALDFARKMKPGGLRTNPRMTPAQLAAWSEGTDVVRPGGRRSRAGGVR